jgi:hypothetical protein
LRATEGLAELLARVGAYTPRGPTILDECGVLARVELSGEILPGVDIPRASPTSLGSHPDLGGIAETRCRQ